MPDGSYPSDWLVPTPMTSLAGDGYRSAEEQKLKAHCRRLSAVETALRNEQQDLTPISEHEVDRLA